MKSYFVYSAAVHGLLLAALVFVGTLLSKPRMSYYAVDLLSSLPAGGGVSAAPALPAAPATPAPKAVKVSKRAAAPQPAVQEEAPDQDTIRLLAKLKQKRLAVHKSESSDASPRGPVSTAPEQSGRGGSGLPGSGAGIVADAGGAAFPYPWYLKSISDRLDKQWRPPQEFEPDTLCEVTFVIDKSGQVSGAKITKSSGDAVFDQLGLRAVLYANPLPPLPGGYPDDTLKVHMKFVGRRQ